MDASSQATPNNITIQVIKQELHAVQQVQTVLEDQTSPDIRLER